MQIRLESLERTYNSANSAVNAVQKVTLSIPSNKIFGIIGKSGAGKSTLVRLISLLEKPDTGPIFYNDKRVDNLEKAELIAQRRRIGMIFQNFNLFSSRTAAQNVAYPMEICGKSKEEIKMRVTELLALVNLSDKANSPISALSGGQKQRVAIARALANNPDILFCDEATSALDPQTTRAILDLIREIQQKMNLTVVMITHQMEVVRDACDYVAVLDNGKVVEEGLVSDIFTHPKSEVTKDFLSHLTQTSEQNTDNSSQENIIHWSKKGGKYTLRFVGDKTDEPVLSELAHQFNVQFNIHGAGIQQVQNNKIGTLKIDISGESQEVAKALDYLTTQGVLVENE